LFVDGSRSIDYEVTLKASHGDVVFGDTKEGSMGIRTHPALRLKGPVAKGKAVNSEGIEGGAIWGKRAKCRTKRWRVCWNRSPMPRRLSPLTVIGK
jgi:hypothetical protein